MCLERSQLYVYRYSYAQKIEYCILFSVGIYIPVTFFLGIKQEVEESNIDVKIEKLEDCFDDSNFVQLPPNYNIKQECHKISQENDLLQPQPDSLHMPLKTCEQVN